VSTHTIPAEGFVHVLTFSPDGTAVAMGTDSVVTVWETASWQKRAQFSAPIFYPRTVEFSPDGALVAAGGKDGVLTVWNVAEDKEQVSVKAHLDFIHAVAFSRDGARLVTASFDRTAKLWEVATGRQLREFRGHNDQLMCAAFNPAGTRLATGAYDGLTKLWAIDSDLGLTQADAMDFCPSRGYLAGSVGSVIKLWDSHTGHVIRTFEGQVRRDAPIAFDPAGKRVAATADEETDGGKALVVRLWDVDTGRQLEAFDTQMRGVEELGFSPGGGYLAASDHSTLKVWHLATRQLWRTVEDLHGFVFSPSGAYLATGKREKVAPGKRDPGKAAAFLWKLGGSTPHAEFKFITWGDPCLGFSHDGSLFLAGHDDVEGKYAVAAILWDVATGEELIRFHGHDQGVTCASFSADGTRLATGSKDKKVKLWDLGTREELHTLVGHAGVIKSVLFSHDGNRVVTASEDGTFKIWDCETGRELFTLQDAAQRAKGVVASPDRAVFSPDGRQLVVLTEPTVLPPVVLHSFPWDIEEYPGDAEAPLQDRIEAYKRQYWAGGTR